MARKIVDVGQKGNDGTGDSLRDSFRKINENFQELYSLVGVSEKLSFTGLSDTPDSFVQQNRKLLSVNDDGNAVVFKRLIGTGGVNVDFDTSPTEIRISSAFSRVQSDDAPVLGGTLRARSGVNQYRILDLGTTADPLVPIFKHEAVNKAYADSKLSLAGTDAISLETGSPINDPQQGIMTGPLILSRDPVSDDDVGPYGGLIAATKRYVDNSSYFSKVNLYVSTTGNDHREDLAKDQKGRAYAYSFRSIEAAARRAEELILEAPLDLGPYKKRLTFNNRTQDATLTSIVRSPLSGDGATATASMTIDTIEVNNPGSGYLPDDIISISGGAFTSQILIRVKTTAPNTGSLIDWEVTADGDYSQLPGSANVASVTNSIEGSGATFNVKWKVNRITVTNGGSGYDLVSARFVGGGGGVNAFAEATVTNGVVTGINIVNPGTGYTTIPTVVVELPRLKIFTNGLKTDYTVSPGPSRDIREGLYLKGVTSGALAIILSHDGSLDGLDEVFDVDIISGTFILGEKIEYGDPIKKLNVTILLETGTYEENFPIKLPANVSIAGDEFRRIIIKPKAGQMSTSPWASVHFYRDTVVDGLTVATQKYGRHYLTDSSQPIYPLINNKGGYKFAARLLELNRSFIKSETIGWIEAQINLELPPFTEDFVYNRDLCKRDVGLLIDAMVFDLTWGGQDRTVSAALKYYESASSLIAITDQKAETLAAINYARTLAQSVIDNVPPSAIFQTVDQQVINPAIFAEAGSDSVINSLFGIITDIIDDAANFNPPKNNDDMDVFLCNDATRIFHTSITGAGGFAMVLDPTGQILTKSPYGQVGSVFSKSTGVQSFAGSLLIDGFAGNQQFLPISKSVDGFLLNVGELVRKPQTPFSFFRNGVAYRVNFVRNYQFNPAGSTAQFVLDELTPYTPALFTYNEAKCYRDVGLIVDAITNDIVFGTNYQSAKAGLSYRRAYTSVVIDEQVYETIKAIEYLRDEVLSLVTDPAAKTIITARFALVTSIIRRGESVVPVLIYPNTTNKAVGIANAGAVLQANKAFIKAEIIAWIAVQKAGSIAPFTPSFTYDSVKCARDVGYIVDALLFDLAYGGNISVIDNAIAYWYDGTVISGQTAQSAAAYTRMKTIIQDIVQNITVTPSAGNTQSQVTSLPAGSGAAATTLGTLMDIIINGVQNQSSIPATPTPPEYANSTNTLFNTIRTTIQAERTDLQQAVIDEINTNISKFELVTPGNRSMLSNDFTCINDMGYGILATNGGLTEAVSMFTYYCYTAYYALNGGQIRSVGGSSANGVYALKAEGADPLEVPDIVSLGKGLSQGATVYAPGGVAPFQSVIRGLSIYVTYDSYVPLNQSEIEINFDGEILRYAISGADTIGLPAGVAKLNISTAGQNNTSTSGLKAPVPDGTRVTIRCSYELLLDDVQTVVGTRPSTALVFFEDPEKIYRVLAIGTSNLPVGQAVLTLRENYDYVEANVFDTGLAGVQPADHGEPGDTQVAITDLSPTDSLRAVGSQFCWLGTVHTITAYENSTVTGETYARIKFSPALNDSVVTFDLGGTPTEFTSQIILKLGAQAGANGDITTEISTARFTGHDLLDIGTGSYSDTNYPNVIYGPPANPKKPENEVIELGKGRVFYVTTDQDGNFKVGPFFRVDQGTGTVTFAAAIALSSLDGLGFKRGVSISEFSIDDTMTDNATDTVPTEQAVRAYIDRRLGINHNGGILEDINLIPAIEGGYMALNGDLAMKSDMDLGSFKIINMEDPVNPLDAVNKRWHTLGNLQDYVLQPTESVADASILTFTGAGTSFTNAAITGDIAFTRSGNNIVVSITGNSIINADINTNAAIDQSKLNLSTATAASSLALSTRGIASFNSANFGSSSGFISIKANGVTLSNIVQSTAGRVVIGRSELTAGNFGEVTMTDIVNLGGSIKKSQYSAVGYLKRTALGDNTQDGNYSVTTDATGNTPDTLVLRDSNGSFSGQTINAQELRLNNKTFANFQVVGTPTDDNGALRLFSYRGQEAITLGDGPAATDKKNFYKNDEHVFLNQAGTLTGAIRVRTISAGSNSDNGTLTGVWTLSSGSFFNASSGTLQSTSLTTGAAGTAGAIVGDWTLGPSSNLTLSTGGILDTTAGTLRSDTLTTGAAGTAGVITGTWSVSGGSTLVATTVVNQANSATITASSANTASNIVQRDASGNFSAGTITAALSGNASTSSRWATARTVTFTGDVTGSFSIDGSADVSNVTLTVGGDRVTLGTDTTGQYARSIAVNGTGLTVTTPNADDGTDYTISLSSTASNLINTIVARDASGNFSANIITAALSGNASSATTATNANNINISSIDGNTSDQTMFPVLVPVGAIGNQTPHIDSTGLSYNASTNALTAAIFIGALNGNADTATTATTANGLNTGSNYQVNALGIGVASPTTSGQLRVNAALAVGNTAPAGTGEIRATGEVTAFFSSDKNLKENIVPIENALGKLKAITGVMFDWKDSHIEERGGEDGYFVRKHDTGVIAQDVEKVLPEVVRTRENGYKAVQYEKLAGLIIEAIKELSDQVEDIRKRLD